MKVLLDTHAVIWWLADDPNLTETQRKAIQDKRNTCYISAATIWEISIKKGLGKLSIDPGYLDQLRSEGFVELAVSWKHSQAIQDLPLYHRDPFDRILVVQAQLEGMSLVSGDETIKKYDLTII
jgi:PIN domain nuclease of toxin-antitoxin system